MIIFRIYSKSCPTKFITRAGEALNEAHYKRLHSIGQKAKKIAEFGNFYYFQGEDAPLGAKTQDWESTDAKTLYEKAGIVLPGFRYFTSIQAKPVVFEAAMSVEHGFNLNGYTARQENDFPNIGRPAALFTEISNGESVWAKQGPSVSTPGLTV